MSLYRYSYTYIMTIFFLEACMFWYFFCFSIKFWRYLVYKHTYRIHFIGSKHTIYSSYTLLFSKLCISPPRTPYTRAMLQAVYCTKFVKYLKRHVDACALSTVAVCCHNDLLCPVCCISLQRRIYLYSHRQFQYLNSL